MTSSEQTTLWSEISAGDPNAAGKRAYFQSRTRNRLYNFIVAKFKDKQRQGLTQVELAKRMGRKPEVINRYLAGPRNWTLDTISDLLLGISAEELKPDSESVVNRQPRNYSAEELFQSLSTPQIEASQLAKLSATGFVRPKPPEFLSAMVFRPLSTSQGQGAQFANPFAPKDLEETQVEARSALREQTSGFAK